MQYIQVRTEEEEGKRMELIAWGIALLPGALVILYIIEKE